MIDTYSKIVLTVIAVALSTLAVQQTVKPANATSEACGSIYDPCYIATRFPLSVTVE